MIKTFFLAFILLFATNIVTAQINSIPKNLNTTRSSDITDEQLAQIVEQMKDNNMTSLQVYQLLTTRGMSENEAAALRSRIDSYTPTEKKLSENKKSNRTDSKEKTTEDATNQQSTKKVSNPLKIFGLDMFNNGVLSFQPDVKIATPANYVIGPDDEISISIYGYQEARYNLTVSAEGDINIPQVGVIYVSGLTIEQASERIRAKLAANGYANIRTGLTKVNIGIGRIRSIRVTVLGEVNSPGTYALSSLSTAFNALYLSGGPNNIGSLRLIEIVRRGKVISRLDIYDFLVRGDQSGNVNLQDQDVIRVPPYKTRVSIEGEVKRTGLFEVVPGENLEKVLDFAGGFTDSAYTASIKAYKVTDTAKSIIDISKDQFKTYFPSRSESYIIRKIIDRFTNRVTIKGAVYLPGEYELTEGMTVADLIRKAQGLREDAYRERGLITRYQADLTTQSVQFSPQLAVSGRQDNVTLRRNDEVTISSVFDLKEAYDVTISGEVRNPGTFKYNQNITLKDLVFLAGGFTEAAAPQMIEIARRIRKDSANLSTSEIAEVIRFNSAADLNTTGADVKLQPWDVVQVRTNPGYKKQVSVRVDGEVLYPGTYVLQSRNERVSDLIKRAGGLTTQAYERGAYITRINTSSIIKEVGIERIQKMQEAAEDTSSSVLKDVTAPTIKMAVNLDEVLKKPHSNEDATLQEGDVLFVTKEVFEVKVSGEVMFPTQVVYKQGEDLLYYIDKAGGFSDDARKKRTYVLYGNGNASKTKRFLFVKNYPKIEPGAEILVPSIPERKKTKLTTGEVVAISSGIASLVGIVVALLNALK